MHKLEPAGFTLHTIDKKSQLAGRAVDTQLINPISGRYYVRFFVRYGDQCVRGDQ